MRAGRARLPAGPAAPPGRPGRVATIARPRKYTEDELLDAALRLVAESGPAAVTVRTVGEATGAPSGSVYYRFGSRDLLLARLWVRTVRSFQEGFLAALADPDPDSDSGRDLDRAALGAALHVVRWAREHPTESNLLLLRRRSELAAAWPDELGEELASLNAATDAALADHARRRYGTEDELLRVTFALVDVPYAACRRPLLAGRAIPDALDSLVAESVAHTLGIPRAAIEGMHR